MKGIVFLNQKHNPKNRPIALNTSFLCDVRVLFLADEFPDGKTNGRGE